MFESLNIAVTGLTAANARLDTTANNIANLGSDGYTPQRANLSAAPDGAGVEVDAPSDLPTDDLATDLVDLQASHVLYAANAAVVRASDRMLGSLLDVLDRDPDDRADGLRT